MSLKSTQKTLPDFVSWPVDYSLYLHTLCSLERRHFYSYFEMQNHFHHFHLVFIYAEGDKGVSKTAGTKYFSSKCPFNVHLTLLPLYQLDFFLVPYSPTSTSFLPCCRTHPFHFIVTHIFYALPTIRQKKKKENQEKNSCISFKSYGVRKTWPDH